MSAGFIVGSQCVDQSTATDAYYSNTFPATTSGAVTYTSMFVKSASGWQQVTYQDGTEIQRTTANTPVLAPCDTAEKFKDGQTLGWGVVAAMVAAFAIHILRRGLT